ncbi:MAG: hypothetical protein ACYS47_20450 [Planctomycetota bacterium]|jgi:predicted GNAT superfamily acetyltransferase
MDEATETTPVPDGIRLRPLTTSEDMLAVEEVQREVWGFPDREIVPVVELVSAAKAGGCVAGAFHEDELVGFVYGGWGLRDGAFYHYSRMVAVLGRFRGAGLGQALKAFQRRFVLDRSVNLMRWTFDPLEGGNASLNIGKLGAVVDEYIRNYYGMKEDELNRGLPTDRFFLKWCLDSPRVEKRLDGSEKGADLKEILAAEPALSSGPGKADLPEPVPQAVPLDAEAFHVEIPGDIQEMKRRNLPLAGAWREALRETCEKAFVAGFRVEEFASAPTERGRRSAYLFRRRPSPGADRS